MEIYTHPTFLMACRQFDLVADHLQIPAHERERLKFPKRSLSVAVPVAGLPLKKNDAWIMNVLVKPDHELNDRVIIAGFGRGMDNSDGGASRYFAVLDNDIRF